MDTNYQRYGNGGTASAMSMPATSATLAAPIPAILDEQEKTLHELHAVIDTLGERLMLVLAPHPPSTNSMATKDQPPKSIQIISRVQDHTAGLQFAIGRIQDLLARVQL